MSSSSYNGSFIISYWKEKEGEKKEGNKKLGVSSEFATGFLKFLNTLWNFSSFAYMSETIPIHYKYYIFISQKIKHSTNVSIRKFEIWF